MQKTVGITAAPTCLNICGRRACFVSQSIELLGRCPLVGLQPTSTRKVEWKPMRAAAQTATTIVRNRRTYVSIRCQPFRANSRKRSERRRPTLLCLTRLRLRQTANLMLRRRCASHEIPELIRRAAEPAHALDDPRKYLRIAHGYRQRIVEGVVVPVHLRQSQRGCRCVVPGSVPRMPDEA